MQLRIISIIVFMFFVLISCNSGDKNTVGQENNNEEVVSSTPVSECNNNTEGMPTKPFKGRVVLGDFDDDPQEDTLKETLVSLNSNSTITQIVDFKNYNCLAEWICKQNPTLFLMSDNDKVHLNENGNCQVMGTDKLINVGDLNGDKKDEIAVVVKWADWSVINTCDIYSNCDGSWKNIYTFTIHEAVLENSPTSENSIPGFLELDNGQWMHFDYTWNTEPDGSRIKKPLKMMCQKKK